MVIVIVFSPPGTWLFLGIRDPSVILRHNDFCPHNQTEVFFKLRNYINSKRDITALFTVDLVNLEV